MQWCIRVWSHILLHAYGEAFPGKGKRRMGKVATTMSIGVAPP
jgi:hypothetical protein